MNTQLAMLSFKRKVFVSSFRKKLIALFVFSCMMMNGHTAIVDESDRYNAILISIAVTKNVMMTIIFSKYNESLMSVSNNISMYLGNSIFKDEIGRLFGTDKEDKKKEEAGKRGTTSNNKAVVNKPRTNTNENRALILSAVLGVKELFKLYGQYKMPGEAMVCVILLFIMFIIGIKQRKGLCDIDDFIISSNIIREIKISA